MPWNGERRLEDSRRPYGAGSDSVTDLEDHLHCAGAIGMARSVVIVVSSAPSKRTVPAVTGPSPAAPLPRLDLPQTGLADHPTVSAPRDVEIDTVDRTAGRRAAVG